MMDDHLGLKQQKQLYRALTGTHGVKISPEKTEWTKTSIIFFF